VSDCSCNPSVFVLRLLVDNVERHLNGARAADGVTNGAEGPGTKSGLNVEAVEIVGLV
jgi:hypothetical protein